MECTGGGYGNDPKGSLTSYREIIETETRSGETVLVEDELQKSGEI